MYTLLKTYSFDPTPGVKWVGPVGGHWVKIYGIYHHLSLLLELEVGHRQ